MTDHLEKQDFGMAARYVVNVQILRFFAAILVVLAHVGVEIENVARSTGKTFTTAHPLDWGLGVDVFFVISGFIMYYLMQGRFAEPGSATQFLKRRLIRIVPLYWICTTLMLVSILAAGSMINNNGLDPAHILASYAFLPWPRADGELFPLLSLGWTLNYEMFFYIVFAAALLLPKRSGLSLLVVCFAALHLAALFASGEFWPLRFWGDSIIGEFLFGILVAMLFLRGTRLSLPVSALMIASGLGLAVVFFQTESYTVIPRLVTGGVPALMITIAVVLGHPAPAGRASRFLALGGDASYALYLTHPFTIKIFGALGAKAGLPLIALFWLGFLATVAVSIAVHLWVERPVAAALHRRLDGKPRKELASN